MSRCLAARKPVSVLKMVFLYSIKHQKLHLMKQEGLCCSRPRTFSPIADPSSAVGVGLVGSWELINRPCGSFGPLPPTSRRRVMKTGQQKQHFVINLRRMCVVLEHTSCSVATAQSTVHPLTTGKSPSAQEGHVIRNKSSRKWTKSTFCFVIARVELRCYASTKSWNERGAIWKITPPFFSPSKSYK